MLKGLNVLRHTQSMSNYGNPLIVNSPLSFNGKQQAFNLNHQTDIILCSPMKRAIETLAYSNIKYKQLFLLNGLRELICEPGDCFSWEKCVREDPIDFNRKMRLLANKLYLLSRRNSDILIITHGCVIKALTDQQIKNGEIIELSKDRLKYIINGVVQLPTDYHQMTGW